MTEVAPLGRFSVLLPSVQTLPPPAQCALCMSTQRPVIAMRLVIRQYGSVMICEECFKSIVTDVGSAFGVMNIETYRTIKEELVKTTEELHGYKLAVERIHHGIRAIVDDSIATIIDTSLANVGSPESDGRIEQVEVGSSDTPVEDDEIAI